MPSQQALLAVLCAFIPPVVYIHNPKFPAVGIQFMQMLGQQCQIGYQSLQCKRIGPLINNSPLVPGTSATPFIDSNINGLECSTLRICPMLIAMS